MAFRHLAGMFPVHVEFSARTLSQALLELADWLEELDHPFVIAMTTHHEVLDTYEPRVYLYVTVDGYDVQATGANAPEPAAALN